MTNPKGIRRGTRYMFSKDFRKKGVIGLKTYFATYRKVHFRYIYQMSQESRFLMRLFYFESLQILSSLLKRPFFLLGTGDLVPPRLMRSERKTGF